MDIIYTLLTAVVFWQNYAPSGNNITQCTHNLLTTIFYLVIILSYITENGQKQLKSQSDGRLVLNNYPFYVPTNDIFHNIKERNLFVYLFYYNYNLGM